MGHLHASTSLRMGTGVARNLESARTDPDYHCGRPPYLDSGLEHCADSRYRQAGTDPLLLIMRGPYRFTRNPMYVAELGLWLGWALFFGSPGVFIGFVVLLSVVSLVILPREERGLEAAFGQAYLQYKDRVPRWLGKANY